MSAPTQNQTPVQPAAAQQAAPPEPPKQKVWIQKNGRLQLMTDSDKLARFKKMIEDQGLPAELCRYVAVSSDPSGADLMMEGLNGTRDSVAQRLPQAQRDKLSTKIHQWMFGTPPTNTTPQPSVQAAQPAQQPPAQETQQQPPAQAAQQPPVQPTVDPQLQGLTQQLNEALRMLRQPMPFPQYPQFPHPMGGGGAPVATAAPLVDNAQQRRFLREHLVAQLPALRRILPQIRDEETRLQFQLQILQLTNRVATLTVPELMACQSTMQAIVLAHLNQQIPAPLPAHWPDITPQRAQITPAAELSALLTAYEDIERTINHSLRMEVDRIRDSLQPLRLRLPQSIADLNNELTTQNPSLTRLNEIETALTALFDDLLRARIRILSEAAQHLQAPFQMAIAAGLTREDLLVIPDQIIDNFQGYLDNQIALLPIDIQLDNLSLLTIPEQILTQFTEYLDRQPAAVRAAADGMPQTNIRELVAKYQRMREEVLAEITRKQGLLAAPVPADLAPLIAELTANPAPNLERLKVISAAFDPHLPQQRRGWFW